MREGSFATVAVVVATLLSVSGCARAPLAPVAQNTDELVRYVQDPNSIIKWYHLWGARKNVTGWFPSDYQMGGVYRVQRDIWLGLFDGGSHAGNYRALRAAAITDADKMASESPPPGAIEVLHVGTRVRFQQMWIESDGRSDALVMPYVEVLEGPLQGQWVGLNAVSITKRRTEQESPHPCNVDPQVFALATDDQQPMALPGGGLPPGVPPYAPSPGVPPLPVNVGVGPFGNGPVQLGVGPFGR